MDYFVFGNRKGATYENKKLTIKHSAQNLEIKSDFKPENVIKCYEYLIQHYGGFLGTKIVEYATWFLKYYETIDFPTETDKINKLVCEEFLSKNYGINDEYFKHTYNNKVV